ncbi:MAG TPA: DUF167 domain-containing protein [Propionicimonas sp.]|nr:DUF167 domain-containing protein [Propionicimonas sp.]
MAAPPQPGLRADRRERGVDPRQGRRCPAARLVRRLAIHIEIRVKPGAGRTRVGGRYGDATLIVAVSAPAVDGRATEAALTTLAAALGCKAREVSLVSGATSRTKVVEVPDATRPRYLELLDS